MGVDAGAGAGFAAAELGWLETSLSGYAVGLALTGPVASAATVDYPHTC